MPVDVSSRRPRHIIGSHQVRHYTLDVPPSTIYAFIKWSSILDTINSRQIMRDLGLRGRQQTNHVQCKACLKCAFRQSTTTFGSLHVKYHTRIIHSLIAQSSILCFSATKPTVATLPTSENGDRDAKITKILAINVVWHNPDCLNVFFTSVTNQVKPLPENRTIYLKTDEF